MINPADLSGGLGGASRGDLLDVVAPAISGLMFCYGGNARITASIMPTNLSRVCLMIVEENVEPSG